MRESTGIRRLAFAIFLTMLGAWCHAQSAASEIEAVAAAYAASAAEALGLNKVVVSVQAVDPRLKLAACSSPVKVLDDGGGLKSGRMVLRVGCPDLTAWSVYVPVLVRYEVSVYRFRRNMVAGESLGLQDLVQEWVPGHSQPMQAVTNPDSLLGMALIRGVSAGSLAASSMFRIRPVVEQGQRVTIRATGEGLQISMEGIALGSGITGDLVQVKNLSSGKALEGRIVAPGMVEVGR